MNLSKETIERLQQYQHNKKLQEDKSYKMYYELLGVNQINLEKMYCLGQAVIIKEIIKIAKQYPNIKLKDFSENLTKGMHEGLKEVYDEIREEN